MSRIVWSVSVSLDGFTTGPDVGDAEPMGVGGEALHAWMDGDAVDRSVTERINQGVAAAIVGRRTFDLGLRFWGGTPWSNTPTFVVTHRRRSGFAGENGGSFTFVDLAAAVEGARAAAGDGNVMVLGAAIGQQLLAAGHLDELWLQQVPILLRSGTPLLSGQEARLEPLQKPLAGSATHQFYRVVPA